MNTKYCKWTQSLNLNSHYQTKHSTIILQISSLLWKPLFFSFLLITTKHLNSDVFSMIYYDFPPVSDLVTTLLHRTFFPDQYFTEDDLRFSWQTTNHSVDTTPKNLV